MIYINATHLIKDNKTELVLIDLELKRG